MNISLQSILSPTKKRDIPSTLTNHGAPEEYCTSGLETTMSTG